ncbi:MAG: hypothetical protein AB7U81_02180 [Thiohalomonadaceae bacterium]
MSRIDDADELRRAQAPHELFLFNLIFNHVFLFIATISAPSLQFLVAVIPSLSVAIVIYTLVASRRAARTASPFVSAHWQLAARRTRMFIAVWVLAACFMGLVLATSGGTLEPWHYAVGSLVFIPTMLLMLALVIMESEALQYARAGSFPGRSPVAEPAGD